MRTPYALRFAPLLVLSFAVALALPGCTLLGLGAAAGATVGGCALLDDDDDDTITEAEFSAGLFDAWDTDGDDTISMAEFNAGVASRPAFSGVAGDFDAWDTDNSGMLTQAEFRTGIAESGGLDDWLDARCDDLGL